MTTTGKLMSMLGATCLAAFATALPAEAAPKPCCYNNGQYFESTPKTCYRYGGRIVNADRCYRGNYGGYDRGYYDGGYDDRRGPSFAISIGDIVFAYTDGYYDRHRRWHRWRNDNERNWYRKHYSGRYHGFRRDNDRDHRRREWWQGRRDRWN